jgi:hypothetical protein
VSFLLNWERLRGERARILNMAMYTFDMRFVEQRLELM